MAQCSALCPVTESTCQGDALKHVGSTSGGDGIPVVTRSIRPFHGMSFGKGQLTDGVMLLPLAKTVRQRQFVLALLATQHVEQPLIPEVRFNLDDTTDANAVLDYRFDVVGIRKLGYYLGLPAVVVARDVQNIWTIPLVYL
ncbi:hypothetical protein H257_19110 [Aphanomyces astaci]|uniref:Uncharacterized protein n=1 Tax=Aphanomyces astaci TaxID=112090 RepID=W4FAV2_APHAT|nr:hypothetical protein H257_19110 [Aphanomyces astaci]ETV63951.1 hypothetical protein H257_19110 [Aphanomyces astaci]|eukprot:XP_009846559.1 hypothetical protein H257_19110 [Aphanomyces astaci]